MSAIAQQRDTVVSVVAALAFCVLALLIVELARVIFLWNALGESTRRVAPRGRRHRLRERGERADDHRRRAV